MHMCGREVTTLHQLILTINKTAPQHDTVMHINITYSTIIHAQTQVNFTKGENSSNINNNISEVVRSRPSR